jgi:hypothetical protein
MEIEKQNDELRQKLAHTEEYVDFLQKHLYYKLAYNYHIQVHQDIMLKDNKKLRKLYTCMTDRQDFATILVMLNENIIHKLENKKRYIDVINNNSVLNVEYKVTSGYKIQLSIEGIRSSNEYIRSSKEYMCKYFNFDVMDKITKYNHVDYIRSGWAL